MWVCENCGESHEDQFTECWKCAGEILKRSQVPDQSVRTLKTVINWSVLGMLAGVFMGGGFFLGRGQGLTEAIFNGCLVGLVFGGMVGAFLWVFFPYQKS